MANDRDEDDVDESTAVDEPTADGTHDDASEVDAGPDTGTHGADGTDANGVILDRDGEVVEHGVDRVDERSADAGAGPIRVAPERDRRVPAWLDTAVQYTWRGLILLVGIGTIIFAMTKLALVSLPVIVALILATICVPPARRLERRGVPRLLAAFIVVIGGIGGFVGAIALMVPTFIEQGQELQPQIVEGAESVLVWLEEGPIGYDRSQVEDLFATAVEALDGGAVAASVGQIAVSVFQGLAALALAIVLLFFFVKDGEQIVNWFIRLVPDQHRDDVRATGARGWGALSGFVRGTALVALIDAVPIGLGLWILDVPAYLPLAVLVFFGGFIPVIGATVTGLLAILVALASGGFTTALIVGGIVLAVQQIESNVLQPTIMRRAVSLHPVVVLGVLTAGSVLVGIVGAFLAVPITAVLAAVGNELRLRHEVSKQGGIAGPQPIGGPGIDPETVRVRFPEDTQLRSARRRDRSERPRRQRRRTREKVHTAARTPAAAGTGDGRAAGGGAAGGTTADGSGDQPSHVRANRPAPASGSPGSDAEHDGDAVAPSDERHTVPLDDGYDTTLDTTELKRISREQIPDRPDRD
jgi:putative heme transporter